MLSLSLPFANGEAEAADAGGFAPNAFIRIDGDGQIVLTMPYVEMGQGDYTAIPMLIAEELEVDLKQVRLEHAPPNEKLYGNPLLGGSSGDRRLDRDTRGVGADAASRRDRKNHARVGGGKALECRSDVLPRARRRSAPRADGRRIKYGELAADAARMPDPSKRCRSSDRRISSSSARRPSGWIRRRRSTGSAVYGIDARPPGVKIATLAQSPVFGGRVKNVDDAAAKAVNGVRQIVRLDDAVAVVADHMGAAKKGLAALVDRMGRRTARQARHRRDRQRARKGDAQFRGGRAEYRRCRQGDGERRRQGRGDLPGSVSRARDDGADELHGPCPRGRLRGLGRQPSPRASPGRGGEGYRSAVGKSRGPQSPDRRRVRPAAGDRRRRSRRRDRQTR